MEPLFELALRIPPRGSRNLLRSLYAQLRDAIVDGRLRAGQRMPSTRALASLYGLSRNTAIAAYDSLSGEGYLETRHGSGTYVVARVPRLAQRKPNSAHGTFDARLNPLWRDLQLPSQERRAAVAPAVSFPVGVPDTRLFPFEVWHRLLTRAQRLLSRSPVESRDSHGSLALREAIARHASLTRALACRPDDIIVTAGAQQAFDLLARILITPHRTVVATEDPGYGRLRGVLRAAGARIVPVPVDSEGLVVDRLPRQARVICVTPSHQFPLGTVMSMNRRTALLERARAHGAVIIEDDYDCEFRFGATPLDALQTLDRLEHVFYVGTFSKSLFPGIRLGFVVAPAWARAAVAAAKRYADGSCPDLMQETLASFITEGHLARHVRKMRQVYAERRSALLEGLHTQLSRWLEPIPAAAGLHVTALCKPSADGRTLLQRAQGCGVELSPLECCYLGESRKAGFVLGYGATETSAIITGLSMLHRAWKR
jgi:GntR family transcriptional regulator/MocR family aminotransferase